jgi:hypothetical protein
MKPLVLGLALLATTVLAWDARAGEDAGMDATLDVVVDTAPPPKDTSSPDTSKKLDSAPPPDSPTDTTVTPPVEGGGLFDVVGADGGEFSDVPMANPDSGPLDTDSGINQATSSSGGGCSIAAGVEDRLLASAGLVLGTFAVGVWRGRRRLRRRH